MSNATARRAERGPAQVLNESDAVPRVGPTACNQFVVVEAAPGSLLMLSRGTTVRLGLELVHAAILNAMPLDEATLDEIAWRLDFLRSMTADLRALLPPKVLQ